MTQSELLKSQQASIQTKETAEAFLVFSKHLKKDALARVEIQEDELKALTKSVEISTENFAQAVKKTAEDALVINPLWKPPIFNAYSINEIPEDQNFYIPLKAQIDSQLSIKAHLDSLIKDRNEKNEQLLYTKSELLKIMDQIEKAKQLIKDSEVIEAGLIAEQKELDTEFQVQKKLFDDLQELKRLDEIRSDHKWELNRTKNSFFFNFDIESDQRFVMEKFIEEDFNFFDVYNSKFLFLIKELKQFGEYKITMDSARIDLISYNIYGTTQFWWMLLEFNDIADQFSIKRGQIIKFFDLSDLESKYHFIQKEQHKKGDKEQ